MFEDTSLLCLMIAPVAAMNLVILFLLIWRSTSVRRFDLQVRHSFSHHHQHYHHQMGDPSSHPEDSVIDEGGAASSATSTQI